MSLTLEQAQDAVDRVVDSFPKEFGLLHFPGRKFTISKSASYYSTYEGGVMLYTYVWNEAQEQWLAFAKGTERELRRQIVA